MVYTLADAAAFGTGRTSRDVLAAGGSGDQPARLLRVAVVGVGGQLVETPAAGTAASGRGPYRYPGWSHGRAQKSTTKQIASNRRARHDYTVLDMVEAGLVLSGSEVKSLRAGHVQLTDAFARFNRDELWLEGVHIAPYQFAVGVGAHDPDRPRKLLLHRAEIDRLKARVDQERVALVPLSLYFKDGRAKVELGRRPRAAQKADKRQAIAERDSKREIERALGRHRKGTA